MINWFKGKQSRPKGNPKELQRILSEIKALDNSITPHGISLYQKALENLPRETNPLLWANLQSILADCLINTPTEGQAENIERAFHHLEQALEVFTRQSTPEKWALIQYMFGYAFKVRIRGERADNIEQAIKHFAKSLEVYAPESNLRFWVWNKYHMGNAYSQRTVGDPSDNLEKAIRCLEEALEVVTPETLPDEWMLMQKDLAIFYGNRVLGDSAQNLKQAEYHDQQALEAREKSSEKQQPQTTQETGISNELIEIMRELMSMHESGVYSPRRLFLSQKAVELFPREMDPNAWASLQYGLGDSFLHSQTENQAENIEHAIHCFQKVLEVQTRESYPAQWAATQNRLAEAYRDRVRGDRGENLEQAIYYFQQTIEVKTRESNPTGWGLLNLNLAKIYENRVQGKRVENIEKAIQHYKLALEVVTRKVSPESWAEAANYLGIMYVDRILGDHAENVEQGIRCFEQALEVRTRKNFPSEWAATQHNLGIAFRNRVQGDRGENIEQGIRHFKWALEVRNRADSPEEWADTQNMLAFAYFTRVNGNRADDLEKAIEYYEQALIVRTRTASPKEWAAIMDNLGMAYADRVRGSQTENIEQAIHCFDQALEVFTPTNLPQDWAGVQQHLANVYRQHVLGDQEENVERAIYHGQQALTVLTREDAPLDWATMQHTLGNAYLYRLRGEKVDNLEQAIHHYQQTLTVRTREADPDAWAGTQDNLAKAWKERLQGDRAENLEKAIYHTQQALEVYTRQGFPEDWAIAQDNLASIYIERFKGDRAANLAQAIQHYQQALLVRTPEAFPSSCLNTAKTLGDLAFEQAQWELARDAYGKALAAQGILRRSAFTRVGKQANLYRMQNIPSRAAYVHLRLGEVERAVEVLENGRAQLLRESVEHQRQDLEHLPRLGFDGLYQAYMQAMETYDRLQDMVGSGGTRPVDWLSQVDQALDNLQAAATAIREQAGERHPQYRYFQKDMPCSEIQEQAFEKPLVYLVSTSAGGFALVLTRQGIQHIELVLGESALQEHVWGISDAERDMLKTKTSDEIIQSYIGAVINGYVPAYRSWNSASKEQDERQGEIFKTWQNNLDTITEWLWDVAMRDVVAIIKENGAAVTLIPTGILALLPLHAAWTVDDSRPTGRRYALDEVNISYAPSVHALWQAQKGGQRPADRLMVVNNPDGSLAFAADEVQAVLDLFEPEDTCHLAGQSATIESVTLEMQNAHILHFSTHGKASWADDFQLSKSSGSKLNETEQFKLLLADHSLTLPQLFELNLDQTRLAVLSACETGVPGLELIEEMVGLPAGMMQAGVPGVIGSMWQVADRSTAMLMARFYMLWRSEGQSPQEALRQGQIWLRDSTTGEKTKFFRQIAKGQVAGISAETAMTFYQHIALDDPDIRAFESPFYWAAFAYTGV